MGKIPILSLSLVFFGKHSFKVSSDTVLKIRRVSHPFRDEKIVPGSTPTNFMRSNYNRHPPKLTTSTTVTKHVSLLGPYKFRPQGLYFRLCFKGPRG